VIYCFSTKWWVQYFDVDAPGLAILVIVVTRNYIDLLRNNFEFVCYLTAVMERIYRRNS
jgi:hypothetical protein